jgi:hypothetical protein
MLAWFIAAIVRLSGTLDRVRYYLVIVHTINFVGFCGYVGSSFAAALDSYFSCLNWAYVHHMITLPMSVVFFPTRSVVDFKKCTKLCFIESIFMQFY